MSEDEAFEDDTVEHGTGEGAEDDGSTDVFDQQIPEPKIEEIPRPAADDPDAPVEDDGPMPFDVPEARVNRTRDAHPNNLHNNITFRPELLWRLTNSPADGARVKPAMRQRIGQAAIKRFLAQADQHESLPVRAIGAKWSLSRAAATPGWLALTEDLAYTRTRLNSVHARSPYRPEQLAWVQCGTRVAQINSNLGRIGRSLMTTGASNGQTIIGATATGTHGAAFRVGSMQDTIRAMHIMCSATRHVWLEPSSAPVIADDIAKRVFGADVEIIRDDDTFHSAQVSFGSFGIIESVILETVPMFLLTSFRETKRWDDALAREIYGLADNRERNKHGELYHYEVIFDPLQLAKGDELTPWVTKIYSRPAPAGYKYQNARAPKNIIITDPSAVRWAKRGARAFPRIMLKQASKLMHERFPLLNGEEGAHPLGVVFTDVVMDALGASTEIGVALRDAPRAANVISGVMRKSFKRRRPFLGPMSMRFVKASQATLAFTHFGPISCAIELPGARMSWTPRFYREVFAALDDAEIQFALHWGQENDFSPARIQRSYGKQRVAKWRRARARILNTESLRERYSNPMLEACGLD